MIKKIDKNAFFLLRDKALNAIIYHIILNLGVAQDSKMTRFLPFHIPGLKGCCNRNKQFGGNLL